MPLHIFICDDWFLFLEGNDFKNYLKMYLKYWKRKGKVEAFFISVLARRPSLLPPWPSSSLAQASQRSRALLLSFARRVVGRPNRPKPQAATPFSFSPCVTDV
jgi:hypothetical protein